MNIDIGLQAVDPWRNLESMISIAIAQHVPQDALPL